jgi:hypothetical protein
LEVLCFRDDEPAAESAYQSQSLERVAGNDWPNFEPSAKARIHPKGVASLEPLRADQWEIGCVAGNPDGICAAWVFRARYASVLAVIEFDTSAGGIRFSAMRRLVRSIDRETSAAQHSN